MAKRKASAYPKAGRIPLPAYCFNGLHAGLSTLAYVLQFEKSARHVPAPWSVAGAEVERVAA
jgi:hypothetical protein